MVETFIYLFIPRLLLKKAGGGALLFALISSVLFAASHSLQPLSFTLFFVFGLVLATGYVVRDFDGGRPSLHMAAVHGLKNLIGTLIYFAEYPRRGNRF